MIAHITIIKSALAIIFIGMIRWEEQTVYTEVVEILTVVHKTAVALANVQMF